MSGTQLNDSSEKSPERPGKPDVSKKSDDPVEENGIKIYPFFD